MPPRCFLGCPSALAGHLHVFPNPERLPEQFKKWVNIVGGQLNCLEDYEFYRSKRICDRHFTEKARNRYNRLNALAVPSLEPLTEVDTNIPLLQATSLTGSLTESSTSESAPPECPIASTSVAMDWLALKPGENIMPGYSAVDNSLFGHSKITDRARSLFSEHNYSKAKHPTQYNVAASDSGVEEVGKQDENVQIEEIEYLDDVYLPEDEVTEDLGDDVLKSGTANTAHTQQTEPPHTEAVSDPNARTLSKPVELSTHLGIPPTQETKPMSGLLSYKELQDQYTNLNKEYRSLQKRHEFLKKRMKPNKEQIFEMLTANMNPIARDFFRTQLWAKKTKGVRFSAEEKILALSILKLSGACYSLLQKIFILPSKHTLHVLYKSITAKDILPEKDDLNQFVDEAQDKDGETVHSNVLQEELLKVQHRLNQSLMPQDNLHQSHVLEDNKDMSNVFQDSVNESNVIQDSVNESNVIQDSVNESNVIQDSVNESNVIQDSVNESNVIQDSVNVSNVLQISVNELNDSSLFIGKTVLDQSNMLKKVLIRSQGLNEQKLSHVSELQVPFHRRRSFLKSIPRKVIVKLNKSEVIRVHQKNKSVPELETPLAALFDSMIQEKTTSKTNVGENTPITKPNCYKNPSNKYDAEYFKKRRRVNH